MLEVQFRRHALYSLLVPSRNAFQGQSPKATNDYPEYIDGNEIVYE